MGTLENSNLSSLSHDDYTFLNKDIIPEELKQTVQTP